jgi:hypothetical protein
VAVREGEVRESVGTLDELLAIVDAGPLPRRAYAIDKVFRRRTKLVL